jgi:CubicO group peptidase (beta-lactamase class C family)
MTILRPLAILSFAAVAAHGQTTLADSMARRVDAVFARYGSLDAPGCALGVYQNGHTVMAKGYGAANIEYAVPLTPTTPMIMGSVSKQFTAASIALLVDEGRISLDDDVRMYLPELPDYGKRITIDHLVHHTSGLRDFWALAEAGGMRLDDGYTVSDMLALAARQHHLNFDPGAEYNYSNTGYVALGEIVHRMTGKSLREFAAERIFTPLGMNVSHFHDDHNQPVMGRAFAYSPAAAGAWRINVWNNDIVGQGGLMTTVEDLAKWDENFYTGRVGGAKFLALQLQQGKLNDGTVLSYAFGLQIGDYRGLAMVEHGGSTGGYRTDITRFPSAHTSVVTMCNVSTADAAGMAHRVADVVLAAEFTKPVPTPPARAAAQQGNGGAPPANVVVTGFAGRFYSDELNSTFDITASANVLVLKRAHAGPDTLRAADARTFRGAGLTVHFATDGAAPAPGFTVDNGRARGIEFVRVLPVAR